MKKEELLEWLKKIEEDGIPDKKIFQMMWEEIIKVIRKRFEANESWESVEAYIQKQKETFSGDNTMAGPDAAQKVFNQVSAKIWSINQKEKKVHSGEL